MVKIWFISDTHNEHGRLVVPDADIVVHCGDESTHREPALNEREAVAFFDWFSALRMIKIFVPGNHSTAIHAGLVDPKQWPTVRTLVHEAYFRDGVKLFGSPYTPEWGRSWAYMRKRGRMNEMWETIPTETEVLITHGPPKGILDTTTDRDSGNNIYVGCSALRKHVDNRIKPKIHAFGHIHDESGVSNFGVYTRCETKFVNCSVCDIRGNFKNNGIVMEV